MLVDRLATAQDLGNGVFHEMLFEGSVTAYTLTSVSREAIDTWTEVQIGVLKEWPDNRPLCVLYDQSQLALTYTPYMKSRFSDLEKATKGKSGRLAIVFGKGFMMQLATMFAKNFDMGGMNVSFFQNYDEALAWLQEIL